MRFNRKKQTFFNSLKTGIRTMTHSNSIFEDEVHKYLNK